jgi:hypothetical protein
MDKTLEIKWTVSHAQNTYGYNICTLYVNGQKSARCNGGNYDMRGTCLGDWLAQAFSDRLLKLQIPMSRRNGEDVREYYGLSYHDPNFNPGKAVVPGTNKTVEEREKSGDSIGLERYQAFYRESSNVPTERHTVPSIDGACGWSSVERIANAIGVTLEYHPTRSRNQSLWTAHVVEDWQPAVAEKV